MRQNQSLVDVLQKRARNEPERQAFVFLTARNQEHSTLTFAQLYLSAQSVCSSIQSQVTRGDRVPLVYAPGLEFIIALMACWLAGAVAVPLVPENFRKMPQSMQTLLRQLSAKLILCDTASQAHLAHYPLACIDTGVLGQFTTATTTLPGRPAVDDLALIQYTSGSTASPKGVMITHGNLMANLEMIRIRFEHNANTTVAGWLPFYHDQGLVGNILQPLYIGARSVLMSPKSFVRDPMLWIQTLSDYKVHSSGGPNFAYQLCVAKYNPAKLQDCDLSAWAIAFNGAEPVCAETIKQFADIYALYGFRREAMYPCYGLAEATLFVSGGHKLQPPVFKNVERALLQYHKIKESAPTSGNKQAISACGKVTDGGTIKIVNQYSKRICRANEIGEIWLDGPHVALGYWNNSVATKDYFHARLDDSDESVYLRTGDLGFLDEQGQLFVTGRIKELIIQFGKNYFPTDLEATMASAHPALEPNRGVIFSTNDQGKDQVVAVQEVKRRYRNQIVIEDIIRAIRKKVNEVHGLTLNRIVIVPPNTILVTTSGKKKRSLLRQLFESGGLDHHIDVLGKSLKADEAFS